MVRTMLDGDLFEVQEPQVEVDGELTGRIHHALLELLEARRTLSTVCPSEAARALAKELKCEWRDLMRPVRYVAGRMVEQGIIDIVQHGRRVEIGEARGPIRLRLRQPRMR
jgi:hypothetical protein